MRNSFSPPQVSRSRSANSLNRCHNLSAVAGHHATILQPHATIAGGQEMITGVSSAVATTNQRLRGFLESSPSLHQSLPELHQPLRGVIQRFLGFPQSLPDACQSLIEANQPLQDAKNQQFGINPPKNGTFQRPVGLTCRSAQIPRRRSNAALPKSSSSILN